MLTRLYLAGLLAVLAAGDGGHRHGATEQKLPPKPNKCSEIMALAGLNSNFSLYLEPVIRAITVNDLKKFEPSVTVHNRVPTINRELDSQDPILLYAPDVQPPSGDLYVTEGMRTMDIVLSHGWDSNYYNGMMSPDERAIEAFRMKEQWATIKIAYDKMKSSVRQPTAELCDCVADVEANGLIDRLRYKAMMIREPALVFGSREFSRNPNNKPRSPPQTLQQKDLLQYIMTTVQLPEADKDVYDKNLELYTQALFFYCVLPNGKTLH